MGVDIPHSINVRIVEDDKTTVTFVIQLAPQNASQMEEGELRQVAGGAKVNYGCKAPLPMTTS